MTIINVCIFRLGVGILEFGSPVFSSLGVDKYSSSEIGIVLEEGNLADFMLHSLGSMLILARNQVICYR